MSKEKEPGDLQWLPVRLETTVRQRKTAFCFVTINTFILFDFLLSLCTCQFQVKLVKVTGRISPSLACALAASSHPPTVDHQCGHLFLWESWSVSVRPGACGPCRSPDGEPRWGARSETQHEAAPHWQLSLSLGWACAGGVVWREAFSLSRDCGQGCEWAHFLLATVFMQQELHAGTNAVVGKAENCGPQWHI